jgi:flagellar biosynthesis/type III secretory pathway M-ring protein FliF/YscJ
MDWLRRSAGSFQAAWAGFPVSTRVVTGFLLVLLALVAAWGLTAPGRGGWVRIVDGATPAGERAHIAGKLKETGIEHRVEADAITVPPDRAGEAMLQLHGSGVVPDEVFFAFLDQTDLFATHDKTSKKWMLAIQGKLAAMIQGLDYVQRAQVLIAEPADRSKMWFADQEKATAAVTLELKRGERMTSARVRGLAGLVTAARPDLKPSNIKILDNSGRIFRTDDQDLGGADVRELEIAAASHIEEKVQNVLPADSRVSAQVRLKAEKWEIKREGEQRSGTAPSIESISVSVLISDSAPDVPAAEPARRDYEREIKVAVRAAAGAREQDLISIRIAPIEIARVEGVPAAPVETSSGLQSNAALGGLVVLGCGAIVVAFRLLRGLAIAPGSDVVTEESLRAPGESILAAQDDSLDKVRDGVRLYVATSPREAAQVARRWMSP